MIIDLILDRKDGDKYEAKHFYNQCMEYGEVGHGITAAMDGGTEEQVKAALRGYIIDNGYAPKICGYINTQKWLDEEPKEFFYIPSRYNAEASAARKVKPAIVIYDDTIERDEFEAMEAYTQLVEDFRKLTGGKNGILCIGELGLWNGIRKVTRCMEHGGEVIKLFQDFNKIIIENGDIVIYATHHDGTNKFTLRRWRYNVYPVRKQQLQQKYHVDAATIEDLNEATTSLVSEYNRRIK